MRKIEEGMIEAISEFKNYKKDNTSVIIMDDEGVDKLYVFLHDHLICTINQNLDNIFVKDCGYQTKTTKSRLNCILSHFDLPKISAKKFQWYIGDEKWTGQKIFDINKDENDMHFEVG